jgi:hypothetical protein
MTSAAIQAKLNVSQATVSRLVKAQSDALLVCGKGKSTQYALAHAIGTAPSQQPIWRVNADGLAERVGNLSFLSQSQIHIAADGVSQVFTPTRNEVLPWFLSPLKAEGFLGRWLAQQLLVLGVSANPETWDSEMALIGALRTRDAPGAMLLGSGASSADQASVQLPDANLAAALDATASDLAKNLPAGSSAGGEQPKFLATDAQGDALLVKFSPPLGTPFGDRWSDLLRMEVLSSKVLKSHGFAVAENKFVQTATRSYLLSKRFDRVAKAGRAHVVSLAAAHHAFVKGALIDWTATGDQLARQKRLPPSDAETIHTVFQFGRLIGNTDMHFGNASLFVDGLTLKDVVKGQFRLAPVYDMLPMRWRPDPVNGLSDYAPFALDLTFASALARHAAKDLWREVSTDRYTSAPLKAVALLMAAALD